MSSTSGQSRRYRTASSHGRNGGTYPRSTTRRWIEVSHSYTPPRLASFDASVHCMQHPSHHHHHQQHHHHHHHLPRLGVIPTLSARFCTTSLREHWTRRRGVARACLPFSARSEMKIRRRPPHRRRRFPRLVGWDGKQVTCCNRNGGEIYVCLPMCSFEKALKTNSD